MRTGSAEGFLCGPADTHAAEFATIAESTGGIGAVLPGLPCGIIAGRGEERGVKLRIGGGVVLAIGGMQSFPFRV
jgi:hypothetical protein